VSISNTFANSPDYQDAKTKRVCVIGAGLSGLCAIKEIEEAGHEVVCYEQRPHMCGVFSEDSSYDNLQLTVSNHTMAFSDFFPADEDVRYWTKTEYRDYLHRYADFFQLMKNIQFGTEVKHLKRDSSDSTWEIEIEKDEQVETCRFDAIAICSGVFQNSFVPKIPGLDRFKGQTIHSSEYRNNDSELYRNRKVLCIGLGESGSDIASEISQVANKTIVSIRRAHVFAPRYLPDAITNPPVSYEKLAAMKKAGSAAHHVPLDATQNRVHQLVPPFWMTKFIFHPGMKMLLRGSDTPLKLMAKNNLRTSSEAQQVATKNESIFIAIAKNDLHLNDDGIKEITTDKVIFNSGEEECVDTIVFCTGYRLDVPFLGLKIDHLRSLYKQMIHPELGESVAFIGMVRPVQGGIPLMAEMQSRYFSLLCSGKRQLESDFESVIDRDRAQLREEFCLTPDVEGLVNGLRYNESLAKLIGCQPPTYSILFSPILWAKYWFGHVWPIQYRIEGPGSREEARERWQETTILALPIVCFGEMFFYWVGRFFPFGKDFTSRRID